MIARHPARFTALVIFGVGTILLAFGLIAGWSNGALGTALVVAAVLGGLARGIADDLARR